MKDEDLKKDNMTHPTNEDILEFNRKESEKVNHPNHYGGKESPYEAIKVIEAWDLGFNLDNTVKYISRAGKKINTLEDLDPQSKLVYNQRSLLN